MAKKQKLRTGNCLSRLFYLFVWPILKTANRKIFEEEDLRRADSSLKYQLNKTKFARFYAQRRKQSSLAMIILKYVMPMYIYQIVCSFYGDLVNLGIPFVLKETISWFRDASADPSRA